MSVYARCMCDENHVVGEDVTEVANANTSVIRLVREELDNMQV
jgi:hypothetical protein